MPDSDAKNQEGRCQVKMYGGELCNRPLYDGAHCICHSEDGDKDIQQFDEEIEKILKDNSSTRYDFCGFVFPQTYKQKPLTYDRAVIFHRALFFCDIDFKGCAFNADVNFNEATFHRSAFFVNITFFGKATFFASKFSQFVTFGGSRFHDDVNFIKVVFHDDVTFVGSQFFGDADFRLGTFKRGTIFSGTHFRGEAKFNLVDIGRETLTESNAIGFEHIVFEKQADFGPITDPWDSALTRNDDLMNIPDHGAVFCKSVTFHKTTFVGEAVFRRTIFIDNAEFFESEFNGIANFEMVKFGKETSFSRAVFGGNSNFIFSSFADKVTFFAANFHGMADFRPTLFFSDADFNKAKFMNDAHFDGCECKGFLDFVSAEFGAVATFITTEFQGSASFYRAKFHHPDAILFQLCKLTQVIFVNCDLRRVRFSLVKWNRNRKLFALPRNKVYDETVAESEDFEAVAELYRDLQINFVNSYRYSEAGDFHVGEQEMIRKSHSRFWQMFSIRSFYLLASRYGESTWRPLLWLVIITLFCSGVLLLNGIHVETGTRLPPEIDYINYALDFKDGKFILFQSGFCRVYAHNLALVSFYRTGPATPRMGSWQQVLIIFETIAIISLITLFLLALRRRFRRKSF